ncbi:hypothetical protein BT69DRAFT_1289694 [Atractiella rhizophila]|nr:hypothetical protein BT69DRAFT_1289694 [Atractiella rhizophila]
MSSFVGGMAIGVESYQLRRVRWPVVYRSKTKKDHDLRFDTSTAPKAYRIASVWILRLRYDTRFHVHVFGGTALIPHGCCPQPAYKSSLSSPR